MDPTDIPIEEIPALKPPFGVTSNFEHPYSSAFVTLTTTAIAVPLMLMFVILRIYVRVWIKKSWAREDTACIFAAVSTVTQCSILLSLLNNPLGPHQWNVRLIDLTPEISKKSIGSTVTYSLAAFFTKLSFFLLYFRIFGPNRRARLLLYAGIVFIAVSYGVIIIGFCALCIPRPGDHGGWRSPAVTKRCTTPVLHLQMFLGAVSVASDFYVLTVPIPVLWRMNLPTGKKVRIGAIFGTGLLACLCSVWTLVYRIKFLSNLDITWNSIPLYSLSTAELNIGIMCACFPVLTPLFQANFAKNRFSFFLSFFRSITGSSKHTSSAPSSSATKPSRNWFPLVMVRKSKRSDSTDNEDVENLTSRSSEPRSARDHGGEASLTVGGLKGTGTFLGSRADDFSDPVTIREEHQEWQRGHG